MITGPIPSAKNGADAWRTRAWLAMLVMLTVCSAAHAAVEIIGVDEVVAENVRAFLTVDDLACNIEQRTVRREFAAAPAQIQSALQAFGFYGATIESSLEFPEDCWLADFRIMPGEPVRIRNLDVQVSGEARTDPVFVAAQSNSTLRTGEPLHHAAYDRLKQQFLGLARDRGYPNARYEIGRIDIYPLELAADVALHFESGDRYRFGDVIVHQDVLREEFVAAFIQITPGDPYNNARLTAAYVSLTDSGYFDVVDVRPEPPDHENQTIGVAISLAGAPRRLISYGVGFSTDTGPRLRFGRTIRRWNERGHQLGLNAQLSPVISEVTANYRYPFGDPRFEWMSFDGGVKRENTETATSNSLEFGARRVRERRDGWSRTQLLSLLVEDFEVGEQQGRSRLLMPGMNWSRLRADAPLRPANGSKIQFRLRGASDAIGSDTSFVQALAEAKWIKSLPSRARIILRGQLGITQEDVFVDLPPSVRFFAGGDNSIRGYEFASLGPENAEGEVIGGSGIAVASIEYEHPVRERWSIAVFVDTGNAFVDSRIDAKTGAGFGARWRSPLGPVRFDIGFPINDPDRNARLHVSLGPDL
jgi:translocation and assembly module TamA